VTLLVLSFRYGSLGGGASLRSTLLLALMRPLNDTVRPGEFVISLPKQHIAKLIYVIESLFSYGLKAEPEG
jgi:hypothetical protein